MSLSVAELTSELVRCHPTHRSEGVSAAIDLAAHTLRTLGLDCEIRPYEGGPQIAATHAFADDGPHVIVHGHIDIEDVADETGWSSPGLWRAGEIRAGRVYGAGTSDMLGGIATLITAVRRLAEQGGLTGRVTVQIAVDRHLGGGGTRALLSADLPRAELAVLAEPTNRHVCTTAYGFARYHLTAHACGGPMAYATDESNAATHASTALLALESANRVLQELYPTREGIRYVLPTSIHAGDQVSAPATVAAVDFAVALPPLLPEETALTVITDTLIHKFASAGLPVPSWERGEPHFTATSLGHQVFADLLREVNPGLQWCQYPCPSDARVFQELGVPVVLHGPGDLARTRRSDEYVEIAELDECVDTLSTALTRWLS
ncbi:M20 family metallopeptidase [Nonomuraea jiangxiensis]|uniref:Acetylornithine deacetylase/Succinyl-diaminopimelate desuccinylase n=1 Tax=Nonomuraea jiangxiensis TaxID=633440 RepID=A0A1G9CQ31_9ACTN|nr:M20/M25/M40 family metallo-hydrolase [Nonomuraea jiangxiensis]SDK53781.1 Acetylornithine deacetylase/Succinyl-diaminopimelate desuccinylase [Nonomuraea jiangxiensis]